MEIALRTVNALISALFFICYAYQFLYIPLVLAKKQRPLPCPPSPHRYAVLIAARNESAVIGGLLDSLRQQTYDPALLTVFVAADNCTDDTAAIARRHGAVVYERFNHVNVGKGYALDFLTQHIQADYPDGFDGYFVFDADNIKKDYARVIKEVYNEEYTKTCQMLIDKEGMIWGLMYQKRSGVVTGITLKRVDPKREKVVESHTLPIGDPNSQTPGEIIGYINYNRTDIDPTGTWIYFNVKTRSIKKNDKGEKEQQSVYRMNVETGTFELYQNLSGVSMMYGFAVSPEGEIYLCDCLDYTRQRGYIRHYLRDGTKISHKVGVYPSQIYFPKNRQ